MRLCLPQLATAASDKPARCAASLLYFRGLPISPLMDRCAHTLHAPACTACTECTSLCTAHTCRTYCTYRMYFTMYSPHVPAHSRLPARLQEQARHQPLPARLLQLHCEPCALQLQFVVECSVVLPWLHACCGCLAGPPPVQQLCDCFPWLHAATGAGAGQFEVRHAVHCGLGMLCASVVLCILTGLAGTGRSRQKCRAPLPK